MGLDITTREYYAGQILNGLIARSGANESLGNIVYLALNLADGMIEWSNKKYLFDAIDNSDFDGLLSEIQQNPESINQPIFISKKNITKEKYNGKTLFEVGVEYNNDKLVRFIIDHIDDTNKLSISSNISQEKEKFIKECIKERKSGKFNEE